MTRIDAATNTIVIGDADELAVTEVVAGEVNLRRRSASPAAPRACSR